MRAARGEETTTTDRHDSPGEEAARAVAVVMAGGRGQRLRPLTDKVPKPLLRVGSSSIVERIIATLAAAGIRRVFLSVNYKAEAFEERLGDGERLGVTLEYVRERTAMGTAGALSLLPEMPDAPIVVTNGDIMTRLDFARLVEHHRSTGAALTVAAVEHQSQSPYAVLEVNGDRVTALVEKPVRRDLCNAGIYVLDPKVLTLVPKDTALDMPDLIARAIAAGMPVRVFPITEKWFDIGSPEDFERVLHEFATGEEE